MIFRRTPSLRALSAAREPLAPMAAACLLVVGVLLTGCDVPISPEEYSHRAQALYDKGEFKAAIVELRGAVKHSPSDPQLRARLGRYYLSAGEVGKAEMELVKAMRLGMTGFSVMSPLMEIYLQQGQAKKVVSLANVEGLEQDQKLQVLMLKAQAQVALEQTDEAKRSLQQALELKAGYSPALLMLAELTMEQDGLDLAKGYLGAAAAEGGDSTDLYLSQAKWFWRKGDYQQATGAYREAAMLDPESLQAYLGLTLVQLARGDLSAAGESASRAREISPDDPRSEYVTALLEYQSGEYRLARQRLQRILSAAPSDLRSGLLLGSVYLMENKLDAAERHVSLFIEENPELMPARRLLAQIQLRNGDQKAALTGLESALEVDPSDPDLLILAAKVALLLGRFEEVTDYLNRTRNKASKPQLEAVNAAEGFLAKGETYKARQSLEPLTDESMVGTLPTVGFPVAEIDKLRSEVLDLLHRRRFDDAIDLARESLVAKMPGSALPFNLIGAALLAKGESEAARQSFEKALTIQPGDYSTRLNLAYLALSDGRLSDAEDLYMRLQQERPGMEVVMLGLAAVAVKAGDLDAYRDWLQRVAQQNPASLVARLYLVRAYLGRGQVAAATTTIGEAFLLQPEHPTVLWLKHEVEVANGDFEGARDSLQKLLGQRPGSAAILYRLALLSNQQDGVADAKEALEKAYVLTPENPGVSLALANLELRSGHYEQAQQLIDRLLERQADHPAGLALQGDIQQAQGDLEGAMASYRRSFEQHPTGLVARHWATIAARRGDLASANEILARWLAIMPKDVAVRIMAGDLSVALGEEGLAREHYELVLSEQPENQHALNNLANLLLRENPQQALAHAEKALLRVPHDAAIKDTLGWILLEQGQELPRAVDLLRQAVAAVPGNPGRRYHLAVALAKIGDREEALGELRNLLDSSPEFKQREAAEALLSRLEREQGTVGQ